MSIELRIGHSHEVLQRSLEHDAATFCLSDLVTESSIEDTFTTYEQVVRDLWPQTSTWRKVRQQPCRNMDARLDGGVAAQAGRHAQVVQADVEEHLLHKVLHQRKVMPPVCLLRRTRSKVCTVSRPDLGNGGPQQLMYAVRNLYVAIASS